MELNEIGAPDQGEVQEAGSRTGHNPIRVNDYPI